MNPYLFARAIAFVKRMVHHVDKYPFEPGDVYTYDEAVVDLEHIIGISNTDARQIARLVIK